MGEKQDRQIRNKNKEKKTARRRKGEKKLAHDEYRLLREIGVEFRDVKKQVCLNEDIRCVTAHSLYWISLDLF